MRELLIHRELDDQNENVKNILVKNITDIRSLCSKYFIKNLFVFGSILTDRFNSKSDIDFLYEVDIDKFYRQENSKLDYADNLFRFEEELSDVLKRKIDLLPDIPIQNKYLKESIDKSKQLLYAA